MWPTATCFFICFPITITGCCWWRLFPFFFRKDHATAIFFGINSHNRANRDINKFWYTTKARAKPSAAKKKPRKTGARAAKESAPATPPPNKLKLLSILVLLAGGFGFGLYTLQKLPATTTPAATPASAAKQASEPANQTAEPAPEKRFKFYDILPESVH